MNFEFSFPYSIQVAPPRHEISVCPTILLMVKDAGLIDPYILQEHLLNMKLKQPQTEFEFCFPRLFSDDNTIYSTILCP